MKDSRSYDLCVNPIAGRGEKCYESFHSHVKTIIEIEQKYLEVASRYAHGEYLKYLNNVLDPKITHMTNTIQNVNTFLAAFHDIGKCTIENQRMLERQGTAPQHEFLSTCILGTIVEIGLGKRILENYRVNKTLAVHRALAPVYLAIALHHHAMRGGELKADIISKKCEILKTKDAECSWECLSVIKDAIPIIDMVDRDSYIRGITELRKNISNILRGIFKELLHPYALKGAMLYTYRVAILLSSVLLVADVMAAKLNREGLSADLKGRDVEGEFAGSIYIIEFLKREKLFRNSHRLIETICDDR